MGIKDDSRRRRGRPVPFPRVISPPWIAERPGKYRLNTHRVIRQRFIGQVLKRVSRCFFGQFQILSLEKGIEFHPPRTRGVAIWCMPLLCNYSSSLSSLPSPRPYFSSNCRRVSLSTGSRCLSLGSVDVFLSSTKVLRSSTRSR